MEALTKMFYRLLLGSVGAGSNLVGENNAIVAHLRYTDPSFPSLSITSKKLSGRCFEKVAMAKLK